MKNQASKYSRLKRRMGPLDTLTATNPSCFNYPQCSIILNAPLPVKNKLQWDQLAEAYRIKPLGSTIHSGKWSSSRSLN